MKGHRGRPVAAGRYKLGAAYPVETDGHGWQAAPTTTGRASTVRWPGSGKRDGKVYERNQRLNASQERTTGSNLTDMGRAAARIRASARRTPWLVNVVGREATVKACGVAVARLQGQSWSPNPTSGSQ
jgi:transposase